MQDHDTDSGSRPLLMRAREVAEHLGVSTYTVRAWSDDPDHHFPEPVRIGNRTVRWRRTDIDAWAKSLGGGEA